jgi:hypothetical protein
MNFTSTFNQQNHQLTIILVMTLIYGVWGDFRENGELKVSSQANCRSFTKNVLYWVWWWNLIEKSVFKDVLGVLTFIVTVISLISSKIYRKFNWTIKKASNSKFFNFCCENTTKLPQNSPQNFTKLTTNFFYKNSTYLLQE